MKKLLITGGAGFIGSHTVIEAINRGYEVWNLDILNYAADLSFLKEVENNPKYHFVKGDICDQKLVNNLFQEVGFDYVMHLAAESHVDRSITGPDIFVKTNVLGTQVLLEAALKNKIEKFIHISTDEVYGDLTMDEPEFTETSYLKPSSPYSASKTASDLLVLSYYKTYGMPVCITRCSNNYGPHQDLSKLIPVVISKAMNNEKIPVYGQGTNVRDWLFVLDHVNALFTVLDQGEIGEIYNIGGNNEQKNLYIVKSILRIMDKPESLIEFVEDRLGHDFRYAINSEKIQTELGWQPQQDFDQLLELTVEWYLNQLKVKN